RRLAAELAAAEAGEDDDSTSSDEETADWWLFRRPRRAPDDGAPVVAGLLPAPRQPAEAVNGEIVEADDGGSAGAADVARAEDVLGARDGETIVTPWPEGPGNRWRGGGGEDDDKPRGKGHGDADR